MTCLFSDVSKKEKKVRDPKKLSLCCCCPGTIFNPKQPNTCSMQGINMGFGPFGLL